MKLLKRPIINVVNNHLIDYPTPINFNYWNNFGLLSAVCLGVQFRAATVVLIEIFPSRRRRKRWQREETLFGWLRDLVQVDSSNLLPPPLAYVRPAQSSVTSRRTLLFFFFFCKCTRTQSLCYLSNSFRFLYTIFTRTRS